MELVTGEQMMSGGYQGDADLLQNKKSVSRLPLKTLQEKVDNLQHELYPEVNAYLTGLGTEDRHLTLETLQSF